MTLCASFGTGTDVVADPLPPCYITFVAEEFTLTEVKVRVETNDGCVTFWYENSRAKNPTEVVCNRVTNQLMGLNIKRVEVTVP